MVRYSYSWKTSSKTTINRLTTSRNATIPMSEADVLNRGSDVVAVTDTKIIDDIPNIISINVNLGLDAPHCSVPSNTDRRS